MGPTVLTWVGTLRGSVWCVLLYWPGWGPWGVQCDGSYCTDLGGDPEGFSVMCPTLLTWVVTLRGSVWWVLLYWPGWGPWDGSYCSDLGGDPEGSSQSSVMGPTVVTWVGTLRGPVSPVWWVLLYWPGWGPWGVQCDVSYSTDLGGDPEGFSVMGPTVLTWVGTLRGPVSPVW